MLKKEIAKAAPEPTEEEVISFAPEYGPFWVSGRTDVRPIRFAQKGYASLPAITFTKAFEEAVERNGNKVLLAAEWPEPPLNADGKAPPPLPLKAWTKWTYNAASSEIKRAAKGYMALGHNKSETISILGHNSPFWFMGSVAAIFAGGINNGMYPTDTIEQLRYKLQNSQTSIVLVDTQKNLDKFIGIIDDAPVVKALVIWKDQPKTKEAKRSDGTVVAILSWQDLLDAGGNIEDKALEERYCDLNPGQCSSLVFTSGTTGMPKAVMLSHDNIIYQGRVLKEYVPKKVQKAVQTRIISFLPMSHIAGFMLDVASPVLFQSFSKGYVTVHFARSYDLKSGSLLDRLKTVRPTVFFGVPRVWEKFAESLRAKAPKKGLKKKAAAFAKAKSLAYERNLQLGGSGKKPLNFTAAKAVLKGIHKKLGLDKAQALISGAAPLKLETLEFWAGLGLNILELYGMSESTATATVSNHAVHQWTSVGFPAPGTELKIFKVDPKDVNDKVECPRADNLDDTREECQGELCYRGRHIMLGYLANPVLGTEHVNDIEKKNKAAIDDEGWLHSGDKGFITKTGMVKVTGRYKELIIGAGGENIAPVPIEDYFKASCPAISNVMMIGDKRKYNVALVTLTAQGATGEKPGGDELAGAALDVSPGITTISAASKDPKFIEVITEALKKTNANGQVCSNNAFKIQKFTILPHDFSVETEELTPTQKLKRSVVEEMHKDVIDRMYEVDGVYVPYSE